MAAPRIVLLGMKHCGKSSLGRGLADHYRQPFFDTDDLIADYILSRDGVAETARETFLRVGAEGFEQAEAETMKAFRDRMRGVDDGYVLALGGRTPLNAGVIPLMEVLGTALFLDVDPDLLWDRVEKSGIPPFLDPARPYEAFLELHAERVSGYREAADRVVSLDGLAPVEENVEQIRRALEES